MTRRALHQTAKLRTWNFASSSSAGEECCQDIAGLTCEVGHRGQDAKADGNIVGPGKQPWKTLRVPELKKPSLACAREACSPSRWHLMHQRCPQSSSTTDATIRFTEVHPALVSLAYKWRQVLSCLKRMQEASTGSTHDQAKIILQHTVSSKIFKSSRSRSSQRPDVQPPCNDDNGSDRYHRHEPHEGLAEGRGGPRADPGRTLGGPPRQIGGRDPDQIHLI